mgnify:CR=1 FL=1
MFLSKSHIKKILFIFLFVLTGTITLFTDIYLNLFKKTIQDILIKSAGLYNLQYEKIEGSFIEGFKIIDVTIDSETYLLKSEEVSLNIDFLNILEGFKDIEFLGLENGKLILKNNSSNNISNAHYNQYYIENFQVNNFEIIYDNNVFLLESLNFDFDNGIFYDIDLKGSAKIPYYNANISNFEISFLNESNEHSCQFKVDHFRLKNLYFERLDASGKLTDFFNFEGDFDLLGLLIFEKRFQDVYGEINYFEDALFVNTRNKYDQRESEKKFFISGNFLISNKMLDIKKAILKPNSRDSLIINDEEIYYSQNGLYANDLNLKYEKGLALIKKLKVDTSYNYSLDIEFKQLDIKLFKGLGANGLLSGNLNIAGADSASFSDAKVENFSYKDYSFDSVDIEGSYNNNELSLSDLRISKQIGILNLSGSYSSIDEFYSEFIKGLKVKFKN